MHRICLKRRLIAAPAGPLPPLPAAGHMIHHDASWCHRPLAFTHVAGPLQTMDAHSVVCRLRGSRRSEVLAAASEAVVLASRPAELPALLAAGVVPALLQRAESSSSGAAVQAGAARAVAVLSAHSKPARMQAAVGGAAAVAARLLSNSSAEVQLAGTLMLQVGGRTWAVGAVAVDQRCWTLRPCVRRNLRLPPTPRLRQGMLVDQDSPGCYQAAVDAGAADGLLGIVAHGSAAAQTMACEALANLSLNEDGQEAIVRGDGFGVIVRALRNAGPGDGSALQHLAASTLGNLCIADAATKLAAVAAGVPEALIGLLRASKSKEVQQAAFGALNALADGTQAACDAIVAGGGIAAAVGLLCKRSTKGAPLHMGLTLLSRLALQSPSRSSIIVAAGILPRLVQLMGDTSPGEALHAAGAAAGALANFVGTGGSPAVAAQVVAAGAVSRLAPLMRRWVGGWGGPCTATQQAPWLASLPCAPARVISPCPPTPAQHRRAGAAVGRQDGRQPGLLWTGSSADSSPCGGGAGGGRLGRRRGGARGGAGCSAEHSVQHRRSGRAWRRRARRCLCTARAARSRHPALPCGVCCARVWGHLQPAPLQRLPHRQNCSEACKTKHWSAHKADCRLRRAAAGGDAAAAAAVLAAPAASAAAAVEAAAASAAPPAGAPASQPASSEQPGAARGCAACGATSGLRRCSGCSVVRYCGEACSHAHWRTHRAECRRRQAERAAAEAGAS